MINMLSIRGDGNMSYEDSSSSMTSDTITKSNSNETITHCPPPQPKRHKAHIYSHINILTLDPVVQPLDQSFVNGTELFQKELTPSDVGKLNRLVIPKKHALRFFPPIHVGLAFGRDKGGHGRDTDGAEGMMLEFRDRDGRRWDFRYCYWKSSQSFVFTKGWNKFVKTKDLCPRDTVFFYRCERREDVGTSTVFCVIDVEKTSKGETRGEEDKVVVVVEDVEEKDKKKGFRLFGVNIN